jgi:hypothetical protein
MRLNRPLSTRVKLAVLLVSAAAAWLAAIGAFIVGRYIANYIAAVLSDS